MVDLPFVAPTWASVALTSVVYLTSSTSYFALASSMESGRPDHMTLSGSIGGIKRVDLEASMSWMTEQSARLQPVR